MDLLPDLIIGIDRQGKISYVSKSVSRKLQYPIEALCGASIFDIVTPQSRHVITSVLQRKLASSGSSLRRGRRDDGGGSEEGSGQGSGMSGDDGSADGSGSGGDGSVDGGSSGASSSSKMTPSSSMAKSASGASTSSHSASSFAATTSGTSNNSGSNSSDGEESQTGSGDELHGQRTYAAWSHVNLKRHNDEIDQQNEQAIWNICLVRRDRTTLW